MDVLAWIALAAALRAAPPAPVPSPGPRVRAPAARTPADTGRSGRFQLEDLRRLVRLSAPRISPDGGRVAVVVSRPDWEGDSTRTEIDLVDVASGSSRPLTWGRSGPSEPRWSPDGSRLAFLAPDSAGGHAQIWVLRMDGGDPVPVTSTRRGVDAYSWSPDGSRFAFVTQDTVPDAKALEHHEDAFRVTRNHYQVRKDVQPWHLWTVPSGGGEARRLTGGNGFSLQTVPGGAADPAWSPDGASITFVRYPDVWYGNAYRSSLARVDSAGGGVALAAGRADPAAVRGATTGDTLRAGEGAGDPAFAPGTGVLAFTRARGGDLNNGTAVYVREAGGLRDATAGLARNLHGFTWLPGGKGLYLTGEAGARSALWRQPLDGAAERLDLGAVNVGGRPSVADDGTAAFVGSTASHPDELYVLPPEGGAPRRLTSVNAFVDSLRLGAVDTLGWTGPDGFHEDGVLTFPPDYRRGSGRKLPLVLVVHGGPEGASTADFSALPQLLAARGFLVFQPNYRGSINLGDAYQHAIYRDTGEGPGKDVMAGLDALEATGVVDTARIGVSGWSYGGYMTTWLTSHYHPWKAAVAGAALTDWVMDYTIAFYQRGDLYFFGDGPFSDEGWDMWREQSPIRHARNVTAPTLVMGDVGDPNVPIVNSYEWYHAIRDAGVETEFWAYPADSHFPHDIVRTTDIYRRWVGWLESHLEP